LARNRSRRIAAVSFARDHDLGVSVRGGGHNVAGHAVGEGSVMIELSGMRAVRVAGRFRAYWKCHSLRELSDSAIAY
jgi:FAD/FMN-containing dehydrogenase